MIETLIVEDDIDQAKAIIEIFHSRGIGTTYAASAHEAVAALLRKRYDYIIVDLMLPPSYSSEGLDVLRKAMDRQPEAIALLMTARQRAMIEVVSEAMTMGAKYFFDKNDGLLAERILSKMAELDAEKTRAVFISHGHNELLKFKLKDFITNRLSLRAVVLAEQPSAGMTVVEKLERVSAGCSFAVILMTRDDIVDGGTRRSRQNVVHELGYFQGRYGRSNVVLLVEIGLELFSNISGIVAIPFEADGFDSVFEPLRLEILG